MANKKKQDEALAAVQAQTEENGLSAAQSGYSAAGLGSRSEVENALANASYKPSQTVTSAENARKAVSAQQCRQRPLHRCNRNIVNVHGSARGCAAHRQRSGS